MTLSKNTQLDGYQQLCALARVDPIITPLNLNAFVTYEDMSDKILAERLSAAVQILLELTANETKKIEKIDRVLLDYYIAKMDELLSQQLNAIMHHEYFQQCESVWRNLKYLVDNTDYRCNTKIEILNVDKESLYSDLKESSDITSSGLYKHIYQEYDTPGGEPFAAIISNYEFGSSVTDVAMLTKLAKISAAAHCPFLGSVSAEFFGKDDFNEVAKIDDLITYMERAEYIRWNAFRDSADARYVGLTLPRYLLRLPYTESNASRFFQFEEDVRAEKADRYLWGNATFAFAVNMIRCFKKYGWMVNIRGPESGGKVEQLPLHQYDVGRGLQTKIPTEIIISETRELEYANLGFIPLSYYKNSDYACFFSANSVHKSAEYSTVEATANSRINARLPYVFLSARLGHYLKVIQRENIGSSKNRLELESQLNAWLQTLVTRMNKPGPELAAKHPLREAHVTVNEIPDNPGFYKVNLFASPHFQIEGIDVKLSLVGQIPRMTSQK